MTLFLNLAAGGSTSLLQDLAKAVSHARKNLRIELLGPGILIHDTALMLFDVLRNRPRRLRVHVHTWTCLCDGAALLWLCGDTRSMRQDAWIQIPRIPESDWASHTIDESPQDTDTRIVLRHLGEWLPVHEVAGMRLSQSDLADLGLLLDGASEQALVNAFNGKPPGEDLKLRSS